MIRIAVDAELQARLTEEGGAVEICDQAGRTIGYFSPTAPSGRLKDLSPFSDADIQRFRQQGKGRPLADIWKDLHERYGK